MPVLVRFYGVLRELAGSQLEVQVGPSGEMEFIELVKAVLEKCQALVEYIRVDYRGVVVRGLSILINGRHIAFLGGDKSKVRDGDVVDILPPLHGGLCRVNSVRDLLEAG